MERILTRTAWCIGLVLVQVLLLNKISLFGLATPFLYIYIVLVADRNTDHNLLMLIAFAAGLVVDIFSNTPGVNAAASVLLAFLRPGLLRLFSPREEFENFEPGIHTLGFWPFMRFVTVSLLVHHAAVFFIEAFSFAHLGYLLLRTLCSTLLTIMLVISIDSIRHRG